MELKKWFIIALALVNIIYSIAVIANGSETLTDYLLFMILTALLFSFTWANTTNIIDLFFIGIIFIGCYVRYVFLFLNPSRFIFSFAKVSLSTESYEAFLIASILAITGWWGGKLVFIIFSRNKTINMLDSNVTSSQAYFFIILTLISSVCMMLVSSIYKINMAGVSSVTKFQALIYYSLPADILITPAVCSFIMIRNKSLKLKLLFSLTAIIYVIYKSITGWKSSIFMLIIIGTSCTLLKSNKMRLSKKWVALFMVTALFYIFFFGPLVFSIRLSMINSGSIKNFLSYWGAGGTGVVSIFDRLTVLDPLGVIINNNQVVMPKMTYINEFVSSFIPFSGNEMSFNRLFSILYTKQPVNVVNEFASSLLGAGYILGGYVGIFLLSMFSSAFYRCVQYFTGKVSKSILLTNIATVFITVSVFNWVIDGGAISFSNLIKSVIITTFYYLMFILVADFFSVLIESKSTLKNY